MKLVSILEGDLRLLSARIKILSSFFSFLFFFYCFYHLDDWMKQVNIAFKQSEERHGYEISVFFLSSKKKKKSFSFGFFFLVGGWGGIVLVICSW